MNNYRRNNGYSGYNGNGGVVGNGEDKPTTLLIVTSEDTDTHMATITTFTRSGQRVSSIALFIRDGSVGGHDKWKQIKYLKDQEPTMAISIATKLLSQLGEGGITDEL